MPKNPFAHSKKEGPVELSVEFVKKFRRMEKKRERVNRVVNKLKSAVILKQKNQKAVYQNLVVAISEYQSSKKDILEVYQKYMFLPLKEKERYWERFAASESQEVAELFARIMDLQHAEGNSLMDTLDTDTFLACHISNGRALIKNLVEYIDFYKVKLKIKPDSYIQLEPIPKEGYTVHDLSAKTGWHVNSKDLTPYRMTPQAFFDTLQKNMKSGSPELLDTIILKYAEHGSVPFGDTIENGSIQHYMIETYITYLHELGHALAMLRGDFFDPVMEPFLPEKLALYYHSLEEFLNIVARDVSENKLDPIGIQRFGHTGIEKVSIDKLDFYELIYHLEKEIEEESIQENIDIEKLIKQGAIRWVPPSQFAEKKIIEKNEYIENMENRLQKKEKISNHLSRQESISNLFKLKPAVINKKFKESSHHVGDLLLSSLNETDQAQILKNEKEEEQNERLFDEMLSSMEINEMPHIAPSLDKSLTQSILISSSRNEEDENDFYENGAEQFNPFPNEGLKILISKYKNDPDDILKEKKNITKLVIFNVLNDICIHGMTQKKINHLRQIEKENQLGKLDYLLDALQSSLDQELPSGYRPGY